MLFGHPHALEDAAVRAVEAGLKMVRTSPVSPCPYESALRPASWPLTQANPWGCRFTLRRGFKTQPPAPGSVLVSDATRSLVAHAFELATFEAAAAFKGIDDAEEDMS